MNPNTIPSVVRGNRFVLRVSVDAFSDGGQSPLPLDSSWTVRVTGFRGSVDLPFTISGNTFVCDVDGDLLSTGIYQLRCFKGSEHRFARKEAFRVVEYTEQADLTPNAEIEVQTIEIDGVVAVGGVVVGAQSELADGSVTTDKIADGAVTAAKLATNAVTTLKISGNAVTADKINPKAVTTAKIDNAAVTPDKLDRTYLTEVPQGVLNEITSAKASAQAASSTAGAALATANEAVSIARGRATGYVFDTYEDLVAWIYVESNRAMLNLGDNLYIRATNVPDYWWDGEQAMELESEKPDFTQYATKQYADNVATEAQTAATTAATEAAQTAISTATAACVKTADTDTVEMEVTYDDDTTEVFNIMVMR